MNKTALIVDDSKAMRSILGRTLRELGMKILEAGDGKQAIAQLNEGEPVDLMLVDWNMPVMNGYELLCAVRANPLMADVRIMMVTTEISISQVEQALAAGANEYLMKPATREMVLEKIALLGLT